MIDTLVVSCKAGILGVALLQEGRTVEVLYSGGEGQSLVDGIYLGRITALHRGLNGAFIDFGLARPGFLNAGDARRHDHDPVEPIGRLLNEGAALVVQVTRDALGEKGPRLTRRPCLVGRSLVFHPGGGFIRASRRFTPEGLRDRLLDLISVTAEPGDGFTLRGAAADADAAMIVREMADLHDAWGDLCARRAAAAPPSCLRAGPDALERAVRDNPGLTRLVSDDAAALNRARRMLAGNDVSFDHHMDTAPLFERFDVAAALEEAGDPRVGLPSGGAVIIEETQALCAIDVDSAADPGTPLRINLEAAEVIARQLRLRAVGGIIVIDFLRMTKRGHRRQVLAALAAALGDDRDAVAPKAFTDLGLVEMRRRRTRPSLSQGRTTILVASRP